jgi:hypothetical protein
MARPKLTDVPGIGKTTARVLARNGIRTVAALAEAPRDVIAAIPGFGPVRATTSKQAAIELLGRSATRAAAPKPKSVAPAKRAKPARKSRAPVSAGPADETGVEKKSKKKKKKEKKEKKKKKKKEKEKKRKSGGTKSGKKKDKKKGKKKGKKK